MRAARNRATDQKGENSTITGGFNRKFIPVMTISISLLGALLLFPVNSKAKSAKNPIVIMETTLAKIKIELYPDKAPKSVENFLWYVNHKFYDSLIFHRVIPKFMIQGGGFTNDMIKKEPNAPIANEAANGL